MDPLNIHYMREALRLARAAAKHGDIPVGCVIVRNGEIVGTGENRRELTGDATAHAELEAIRAASLSLKNWRLTDCTLYVTLEPCPMCAGAILNARVGTVVYGATNPRAGCCTSVLPLFQEPFGYQPAVYGGVLEEECARVLGEFFRPNPLNGESEKSGDGFP